MKQCMERLYNGIIKENPTFVLMLGMCPTLAVTTSAINGLGMGLSTLVVLALSNFIISALRKIIPERVRIPAYIVIVATFVTLVELLLHAYVPALHESLGIYISLIVVNCIILGRAESYASKNKVLPSFFDGLGMGLGFTFALTLIGLVREFLGAGTLFGWKGSDFYGTPLTELLIGLVNKWLDPNSTSQSVQFFNELFTGELASFGPMSIMIMAPGAFFILAILTAIQNVIKENGQKAGKDVSKIQSGCNCDCMNCKDSSCTDRVSEPEDNELETTETEEKVETAAEEVESDEAVETTETEETVETAAEEVEPEEATDVLNVEDAKETSEQEAVFDSRENESAAETRKKKKTKKEKKTTKTIETETKPVEEKRKKTLLEVTQELDIVELEELLGKEGEDEANG